MFLELWKDGLQEYDALKGIQMGLAVDGRSADQGRLWIGKRAGPNPTDRCKSGLKRSVQTDGDGTPLGIVVAGANQVDFQLARATIESIPIERPAVTGVNPQGMCMDSGYHYAEVEELLEQFSYTAHIQGQGEARKLLKQADQKARRRVWSGRTVGGTGSDAS